MSEPGFDLVTCCCNTCEAHLQFEREHAGERVVWAKCGMETELYIPEKPLTVQSPPEPPPAPAVPPVIATQPPKLKRLTLAIVVSCAALLCLAVLGYVVAKSPSTGSVLITSVDWRLELYSPFETAGDVDADFIIENYTKTDINNVRVDWVFTSKSGTVLKNPYPGGYRNDIIRPHQDFPQASYLYG